MTIPAPDYPDDTDLPGDLQAAAAAMNSRATTLAGLVGQLDTDVTDAEAALAASNGTQGINGTLRYSEYQAGVAAANVAKKLTATTYLGARIKHERQTAGVLNGADSHVYFQGLGDGPYEQYIWKVLTLTGPTAPNGRVTPIAHTAQAVGTVQPGLRLWPTLVSGSDWWFVARQPITIHGGHLSANGSEFAWGQVMSVTNDASADPWQNITSLAVDVAWVYH